MWTFGGNVYHQLGLAPRERGTTRTNGNRVVPQRVTQFFGSAPEPPPTRYRWRTPPAEPKPIVAPTIVAVAAGDWHSAAVDAEGRLYCWGANSEGQCGEGPDRVQQPRAMGGELQDRAFVDVACGGRFTMGLTQGGEVYLWGKMNDQVIRPRRLSFGRHPIVRIACGWAHAGCIDSEGRLYLFGGGAFGRLGLGDKDDISFTSPTLFPASTMTRVAQVALGMSFSLVLTQEGKLYASGDNSRGQLGNNMKSDRNKLSLNPVEVEDVASQGRITFIAAGSDHAAAVLGDGRVYVWGDNKYGMLGLGDRRERSIPTLVSSLSSQRIVYVACGSSHTIFATDTGRVYACGGGAALVCGMEVGSVIDTPQELEGVQLISHAAAGEEHSILLSAMSLASKSALRAELLQIFNKPEHFADLRFLIDGQPAFYVHQCIAASSPVLRQLLREKIERSGELHHDPLTMEIDLPSEITKGAVEVILRALYGGQLPSISTLRNIADELMILRRTLGEIRQAEGEGVQKEVESPGFATRAAHQFKRLKSVLLQKSVNQEEAEQESKSTEEQQPDIIQWVQQCMLPPSPKHENKTEENGPTDDPLEVYMQSLVNNQLFSDVAFQIEGRSIHAHRAILALRCPYFATMFSTGMRESTARQINMEGSDISYNCLLKLLVYLYTNKLDIDQGDQEIDDEADSVPSSSSSSVKKGGGAPGEEESSIEEGDGASTWLEDCVQLINVAESYQLPHLKYLAEEKAASGITFSTVVQLLESATVLHASTLRDACVVFLARNWRTIRSDHPDIADRVDPSTKHHIEDYLRRNFRL